MFSVRKKLNERAINLLCCAPLYWESGRKYSLCKQKPVYRSRQDSFSSTEIPFMKKVTSLTSQYFKEQMQNMYLPHQLPNILWTPNPQNVLWISRTVSPNIFTTQNVTIRVSSSCTWGVAGVTAMNFLYLSTYYVVEKMGGGGVRGVWLHSRELTCILTKISQAIME